MIYEMFVHPQGAYGEQGADLMEQNGTAMAQAAVSRLGLSHRDHALEIGFGPGLALEALSHALPRGHVTGVDPSDLMHTRAARRNQTAIEAGRMTLVKGRVDKLPMTTAYFDAALAIDNLHFWTDPLAGLHELRRVLRPGAPFLCAFTPPSGGRKTGLETLFMKAGLTHIVLADHPAGFTIIGHTPTP